MGIIVTATDAATLVHRSERMVRWHISEKRDLPARKRGNQWLINTDDLARVPGWIIDREALARLELGQSRSYSGLVARVETMEARARALESHLAALESQLRALLARDPRGQALLNEMPPAPEPSPEPPTTPPAGAQSSSGSDTLTDWQSRPDGPHNANNATGGMSGEPRAYNAVDAFPQSYRGPATVTLLDRGPDAPRAFATRADAARWLERHGVNALTPKNWSGWRRVTLEPAAVLRFAIERQRAMQRDGNWRVPWRLHRCDDANCVCQSALLGGD